MAGGSGHHIRTRYQVRLTKWYQEPTLGESSVHAGPQLVPEPAPGVREVVARVRGHQEVTRYKQASREVGVSAATLGGWRRNALANGSGDRIGGGQQWTAAARLRR
jgi:hypothetical protein